ncbi:MRN complex-interacting protein [Kryptolebias marmoratus]|uniref:MRN complex-interacting protein n=1 Tax=Kryptolebias marmoratus TaxID=37003 RepID=UPI0007F919CE|nr:MRN complex-interacting protein [Kryptolebias marmoratus]
MVQEFHVVRCCSCESFQVQQVKKVRKWTCKLCGQKQSLLKEFGRGSGPDCRRHVQKLNARRGALIDEQERRTWSLWEQVNGDEEEEKEEEQRDDQVKQVSRWSKYLDTPEEAEPKKQDPPEEPEQQEAEKSGLMVRHHLHGNRSARKRHRSEESTDPPAQPEHHPAAPPGLSGTSRWGRFLSADRQVQEEEPSVCGWSQTGAAAIKPCAQLPVRSMFESGEEFSFDEFL